VQPDPKQGEREYFARIGPEGIAHSAGKPFSDDLCAQYLASMSAVFGILPPPPARILEFGCGVGWLSLYLAQRGYDVLGVDIAEEAIAQARASRDARGLNHADFVAADYESFEAPASFDFVIFHDALHHAEDERTALTCAWKSLKPGGSVITLEPGSGHHQTATSQHAIEKYGVHEKDMPPRHIIRLAREIGFRQWLALPHPCDLNNAYYRRSYRVAPNAFERFTRRCLGAFRVLRRLFDTNRQGLVILWK
jgi:SAM-dependent methyltransferase